MVYDHTIHHDAEIDIKEALEHYNSISIELTQDLIRKIDKGINAIKQNPYLFQKIRQQYRKANIERFPYQLIYHIDKGQITFVALAHHKRKPNYWSKPR